MPGSASAQPLQRPDTAACPEFYRGYLAAVPDDDTPVLHRLAAQRDRLLGLLEPLTDAEAEQRYAPGKWSLKELLGHMVDTERVFSYRALVFARDDHSPLPGFEQDPWVAAAGFDSQPWESLLAQYRTVREATLALLGSLTPETARRIGQASGWPQTAGLLAYVIAGHEAHHLEVMVERYGLVGAS